MNSYRYHNTDCTGNSSTLLADCYTEEHHSNFMLMVPENQCVYLMLSDGREAFYSSGEHLIRLSRYAALVHGHTTVSICRMNVSDQIFLSLSDLVSVPELLLRHIAPEMKLYAPMDIRIDTELSVRIENRSRFLNCFFCDPDEEETVLDTEALSDLLQKHLHYALSESVKVHRLASDTDLFHLDALSESIEVDLIGELCSLLESMGLELVSAHIAHMEPSASTLEAFHQKESEALLWYTQVQMNHFAHTLGRASRNESRKKRTPDRKSVPCNPSILVPQSLYA